MYSKRYSLLEEFIDRNFILKIKYLWGFELLHFALQEELLTTGPTD